MPNHTEKYAVLTALHNGRYDDCWTITDATGTNPMRFDSQEAAQAEIDDDIHTANNDGRDAEEFYSADDYMIVTASEIARYL